MAVAGREVRRVAEALWNWPVASRPTLRAAAVHRRRVAFVVLLVGAVRQVCRRVFLDAAAVGEDQAKAELRHERCSRSCQHDAQHLPSRSADRQRATHVVDPLPASVVWDAGAYQSPRPIMPPIGDQGKRTWGAAATFFV
jgi:hypothetical protein